jgi:hypothetical protein
MGLACGWLLCRFILGQTAATASLLATGHAVDAFEACKVDEALEFAVRAAVLNPDSALARSMLNDFRQKKDVRVKACASSPPK